MKASLLTQWRKIAARYDVLVQRERWLVAAGVLGGIVLIGVTQFLDPALQRARQAERSIITQSELLATARLQVSALQSPGRDPDVAARGELAELRQKTAALGGRLAAMESTLVAPQRIAGLLEDLVGRSNGVRLLSLRTLPVAPVLEKKQPTGPAGAANPGSDAKVPDQAVDAQVGLFKHGVEIRLEGSYHDLAAYLARLEKADVKLLWSAVSLAADKHPRLVLTLTVYTLSLDRAWLIV